MTVILPSIWNTCLKARNKATRKRWSARKFRGVLMQHSLSLRKCSDYKLKDFRFSLVFLNQAISMSSQHARRGILFLGVFYEYCFKEQL